MYELDLSKKWGKYGASRRDMGIRNKNSNTSPSSPSIRFISQFLVRGRGESGVMGMASEIPWHHTDCLSLIPVYYLFHPEKASPPVPIHTFSPRGNMEEINGPTCEVFLFHFESYPTLPHSHQTNEAPGGKIRCVWRGRNQFWPLLERGLFQSV